MPVSSTPKERTVGKKELDNGTSPSSWRYGVFVGSYSREIESCSGETDAESTVSHPLEDEAFDDVRKEVKRWEKAAEEGSLADENTPSVSPRSSRRQRFSFANFRLPFTFKMRGLQRLSPKEESPAFYDNPGR